MRFSRSLCVFVVGAFFVSGTCAATSSGFEVTVEVKQKAEDPLSAKEKALKDSRRDAFYKIISTKFRSNGKGEEYSDDDILSCLQDYSIDAEKYSDSYYIARILYKFNEKAMRTLLGEYIQTKYPTKTYNKRESVKIAIFTRDFLEHYSYIKSLKCKITTFSHKFVTIIIEDSTLLKNFPFNYEKCN